MWQTILPSFAREKWKYLTQSYDKSPNTPEKSEKQRDNTKMPPKTSITQRLRTDLGRSVEITTATQLVWFNRLTGSQPLIHHNSCVIEGTDTQVIFCS